MAAESGPPAPSAKAASLACLGPLGLPTGPRWQRRGALRIKGKEPRKLPSRPSASPRPSPTGGRFPSSLHGLEKNSVASGSSFFSSLLPTTRTTSRITQHATSHDCPPRSLLFSCLVHFADFPFLQLLSSLFTLTTAAAAVDLGSAGQFAVIGRSAITLAALAKITGDVGLSPGLSVALTGFTLIPVGDHGAYLCSSVSHTNSADSFPITATSLLVEGRIDAPDFPSSPATLDQAAADAVAAWKYAMSLSVPLADYTKRNFAGGVLSDLTLTPGYVAHLLPSGLPADASLIKGCTRSRRH